MQPAIESPVPPTPVTIIPNANQTRFPRFGNFGPSGGNSVPLAIFYDLPSSVVEAYKTHPDLSPIGGRPDASYMRQKRRRMELGLRAPVAPPRRIEKQRIAARLK